MTKSINSNPNVRRLTEAEIADLRKDMKESLAEGRRLYREQKRSSSSCSSCANPTSK